MSRVFVVQEPLKRVGREVVARIPLHDLEAFGQIVYLFSWSELFRYRDAIVGDISAALYQKLEDKLADFSDDDYLVPLGNPGLIAMAAVVACDRNDGRVRMLDWVRDDKAYRVFSIDMDGTPGLAAHSAIR